jgi:hypothetical protein
MQALAGPYKGENIREQLEERISEHASWVESNGSAQLAAYATFVATRTDDTTTTASAAAGGGTPVDTPDNSSSGSNGASAAGDTAAGAGKAAVQLDAFDGQKPQSLALLDVLDVTEVINDLETRVKTVVRSPVVCTPPSLLFPVYNLQSICNNSICTALFVFVVAQSCKTKERLMIKYQANESLTSPNHSNGTTAPSRTPFPVSLSSVCVWGNIATPVSICPA